MKNIYVLIDPRNKDIKYVGQTGDIYKRLYCHTAQKSKCNLYKDKTKWIIELKTLKLKPIIKIIENNAIDGDISEIKWIKYYRDKGVILFNETDGGKGILGCKRTDETKEKISNNNAKGSEKIVYQYSKSGVYISVYKSATEAASSLNMPIGCITKCARGEQYTGGKYHWSYSNTFTLKPKRKYYGKRTDIHNRR